MKLIFIRHADPDYAVDGLTPDGLAEATLLGERLKTVLIDKAYVSPLGRAALTAEMGLAHLTVPTETKDFLHEFRADLVDPVDGHKHCFWDLYPSYLNEHPGYFERTGWREEPLIRQNGVAEEYDRVTAAFDELLASHGYERDGLYYRAVRPSTETVALFCHFGIGAVLMSHLMNCSPFVLLQGTVVLPSGVSIFATEERQEGLASFRCSRMGDLSHLEGKREPSFAARFCETFNDPARH